MRGASAEETASGPVKATRYPAGPLAGRFPWEPAARTLIGESGCTVHRWRSSNTGIAYTRSDDWGIEVPQPRGPVSFGVLAHEVAHQLHHRYGKGSRPRWLEELEAEEWALQQFARLGLPEAEVYQRTARRHLQRVADRVVRHRKLTPETAEALLARFPDWVWVWGSVGDAAAHTALERLEVVAGRR